MSSPPTPPPLELTRSPTVQKSSGIPSKILGGLKYVVENDWLLILVLGGSVYILFFTEIGDIIKCALNPFTCAKKGLEEGWDQVKKVGQKAAQVSHDNYEQTKNDFEKDFGVDESKQDKSVGDKIKEAFAGILSATSNQGYNLFSLFGAKD